MFFIPYYPTCWLTSTNLQSILGGKIAQHLVMIEYNLVSQLHFASYDASCYYHTFAPLICQMCTLQSLATYTTSPPPACIHQHSHQSYEACMCIAVTCHFYNFVLMAGTSCLLMMVGLWPCQQRSQHSFDTCMCIAVTRQFYNFPSYSRDLLVAPDGGTVALDWFRRSNLDRSLPPDTPILLVFHGLTGTSLPPDTPILLVNHGLPGVKLCMHEP